MNLNPGATGKYFWHQSDYILLFLRESPWFLNTVGYFPCSYILSSAHLCQSHIGCPEERPLIHLGKQGLTFPGVLEAVPAIMASPSCLQSYELEAWASFQEYRMSWKIKTRNKTSMIIKNKVKILDNCFWEEWKISLRWASKPGVHQLGVIWISSSCLLISWTSIQDFVLYTYIHYV